MAKQLILLGMLLKVLLNVPTNKSAEYLKTCDPVFLELTALNKFK